MSVPAPGEIHQTLSGGLTWREPSYVQPGRPIALRLDDVLAGEVFLIRDGLRTLGFFDQIMRTILERAAAAASEDARAALADRGLEALHLLMTPPEALRLQRDLVSEFDRLPFPIAAGFVAALAEPAPPVHVCRAMYVRLLMPEDVVAPERKLLETARTGQMRPTSPHRDSWFVHCSNTVNLWFAISAVRPGNSMMVYPETWGSRPARQQTRLDRSAPLGVPVTFSLDPGDILVFSGEHLHSSEVNVTGQTRFVLTARFTVGPPRYRHEAGWMAHYNLRLLAGPLRPLASARSRMTAEYARHLGRAVRHRLHRPTNDWARRPCCTERRYRGES